MKKLEKNIMCLALIILIIIIFILAGIIIKIKNANTIVNKPEESKGQLTETTSSNAYVDIATHLSEVNAKQQEIDNIQNTSGQATATESQILKNYTAYKDGKLITGTMANNGAVSKTLNAGGSYTIPAGYHNGSGKVTANSLKSQTSATATAADIASGKTAWVNGSKLTGTASTTGKIYKLGSGTSFSIASIVGSGNVGKYSASNFLVVWDCPSGSTTTNNSSNDYTVVSTAFSKTADYATTYNNTTGQVTITGGTFNNVVTVDSRKTTFSISVTPIVYFLDNVQIQ